MKQYKVVRRDNWATEFKGDRAACARYLQSEYPSFTPGGRRDAARIPVLPSGMMVLPLTPNVVNKKYSFDATADISQDIQGQQIIEGIQKMVDARKSVSEILETFGFTVEQFDDINRRFHFFEFAYQIRHTKTHSVIYRKTYRSMLAYFKTLGVSDIEAGRAYLNNQPIKNRKVILTTKPITRGKHAVSISSYAG